MGKKPEDYLGSLDDFMEKVKLLDSYVNSGCVNEGADKMVMPDEIIYSTCSGYMNYGVPGVFLEDGDKNKGRNDYITVSYVNGIERKWLAHSQFYKDISGAKQVFDSLNSSQVYGGVVHSAQTNNQEDYFYELLDFLHDRDPLGDKHDCI